MANVVWCAQEGEYNHHRSVPRDRVACVRLHDSVLGSSSAIARALFNGGVIRAERRPGPRAAKLLLPVRACTRAGPAATASIAGARHHDHVGKETPHAWCSVFASSFVLAARLIISSDLTVS
jgi:hypothetical protein